MRSRKSAELEPVPGEVGAARLWIYRVWVTVAALAGLGLIALSLYGIGGDAALRQSFDARYPGPFIEITLDVAFAALAFGIAFAARPKEPALLLATCAAVAAWIYGHDFATPVLDAWTQQRKSLDGYPGGLRSITIRAWADMLACIPAIIGPLAFLKFTAIFPRRLNYEELTRPLLSIALHDTLRRWLGLHGVARRAEPLPFWQLALFWICIGVAVTLLGAFFITLRHEPAFPIGLRWACVGLFVFAAGAALYSMASRFARRDEGRYVRLYSLAGVVAFLVLFARGLWHEPVVPNGFEWTSFWLFLGVVVTAFVIGRRSRDRGTHRTRSMAPTLLISALLLFFAIDWALELVRGMARDEDSASFFWVILGLAACALALSKMRETIATSFALLLLVPAGLTVASAIMLTWLVSGTGLIMFPTLWLLLVWGLLCVVCGWINFVLGYAHGTRQERRRAHWVMLGFSLAALVLAGGELFDLFALLNRCGTEAAGRFWDPGVCGFLEALGQLPALSVPLLVGCLTIAVFYRGEVDSGYIAHGSLVYGLVALIVVVLFGMLEYALSEWLGVLLPSGGPPVIAAGTCAVFVHPLKNGCERGLESFIRHILARGAGI